MPWKITHVVERPGWGWNTLSDHTVNTAREAEAAAKTAAARGCTSPVSSAIYITYYEED